MTVVGLSMAKVVLIDDEARLLATLARFLERAGLEVVTGESFAAVEAHLKPGLFDVLVTDIVMPQFDGMKVLLEVVENRKCQEPVILVTGEPNLETASQAVRAGAFDYIQKPVTKDRLLEVVNRGLRHVALMRERDEARSRELQMLKNLAEIGESASVLSHEIKTPITGLRHALSAVGDKLGVEHSVLIEEFVVSLSRIERILGQTLSFAKPYVPECAHVPIRELIDSAHAQCKPLDSFANMALSVNGDAARHVFVDAQAITEVFINLFRNAAEACGGSGQIRLLVEAVDGWVRIDVVDSGPGVPAELRSEIFKPFRSSKEYGTGIGLAFSRKVVEAHDGTINLVDREFEACFRMELPVSPAAAPVVPVSSVSE